MEVEMMSVVWANVDDDIVGSPNEYLYEKVSPLRMPQTGRWDTPRSYAGAHIEKAFHTHGRAEAGVGDHYREMDRSDGGTTLWLCLGRRVELDEAMQTAWAHERERRCLFD